MPKYSKEEFTRVLAAHVRKMREERKLSQKSLGAIADKDEQSIQMFEYANFAPTAYYLYELAEGLGVHVKELLDIDFDKQVALLHSGALGSLSNKIAKERAVKKVPSKKAGPKKKATPKKAAKKTKRK